MRLPAVTEPTPDTADLIDSIRAQRNGNFPMLYKVLLNSPVVATGWLQFLTAIRQKTSVSPRLRELIILRIAVLNKAFYEFDGHFPIAVRAGMPSAWEDTLRNGGIPSDMTEDERNVLVYTEKMTAEISVSDEVYQKIASNRSNQEVLDLTAIIAAYNMVSRVLGALNIEHE